jgi:ABC-type transporter Mla subunit MlaD
VAKNVGETAILGDVAGLSVGSGVELRGVPVGKVRRIGFDWNVYPGTTNGYIIVEFEVEQEIIPYTAGEDRNTMLKREIGRGLRAVVKGQGITGTSILSLEYLDPSLYPPPPVDFAPRHYYIPSAPSQFTRLLESIESSLRDVQKIDFEAVGKGMTNVLDGVSRMTDKLNAVNLTSLGTNAEALIVELKGTVAEVRQTIKSMQLDRTGHNAEELLTGLRETNTKLQIVLDQAGRAPIGDTIEDIRQAVQSLNDVLLELKRYPSGFIFGEPPIPAKSVRPPSR